MSHRRTGHSHRRISHSGLYGGVACVQALLHPVADSRKRFRNSICTVALRCSDCVALDVPIMSINRRACLHVGNTQCCRGVCSVCVFCGDLAGAGVVTIVSCHESVCRISCQKNKRNAIYLFLPSYVRCVPTYIRCLPD